VLEHLAVKLKFYTVANIQYLAVHFKNSNTLYFYGMMLETTAASSLPFYYSELLLFLISLRQLIYSVTKLDLKKVH